MRLLAAFFLALALTITWQTYTLARQQPDYASASSIYSPLYYPEPDGVQVVWNRSTD